MRSGDILNTLYFHLLWANDHQLWQGGEFPCIQERSCDKLKILYFHDHIAYGHKTYQGGDIPQGAPTQKIPLMVT